MGCISKDPSCQRLERSSSSEIHSPEVSVAGVVISLQGVYTLSTEPHCSFGNFPAGFNLTGLAGIHLLTVEMPHDAARQQWSPR